MGGHTEPALADVEGEDGKAHRACPDWQKRMTQKSSQRRKDERAHRACPGRDEMSLLLCITGFKWTKRVAQRKWLT